jgi:hypothetical protein
MAVNLNKPLGRVGKRKRSDKLPELATRHLVGGETYCALNDGEIDAMRLDSRRYGDEEPNWPGCWTEADANGKRVAAIARLRHSRFSNVSGVLELANILEGCAPGKRCGSMTCCPQCARTAQKWLVDAFRVVLKADDVHCKDWSFNFVMPDGQVAIADLERAPFTMILKRVRSALEKCRAVEFGVLGIDISANDDSQKFRYGRLNKGPHIYFQVHVYGVVRTRNKKAVWNALRHLFPSAANIYRPLSMSRKPFDGAAKGISYILKPQGFRHAPYFDEARGEWNTPIKPPALRAREYIYYLLAMHRLGLKNRIAFVGLHPEITKPAKTRNRSVRLRRVALRGRAM